MALTDQGTSFSHIFSIILTVALLFLFLCFTLLALRHFKSLAQKIKLLIATAVRKRRQMATYGVKPNPRYFISQLQKQQTRQLQAEVHQKRESNFKIVLYYLYDIYNPVICVFHRCIKRRKERKQDQKRRNYLQRKMQESNRVGHDDDDDDDDDDYEQNGELQEQHQHSSSLNFHSQQNLSHQAQIDLPAAPGRRSTNKLIHKRNLSSEKKQSKLHRRKLEQKEESNELIQVNFLRPSKWFYILQYMGGLSMIWFIILIILAILYISTQLVQMNAALIIVVAIVSALLSCFAVIGFYWYTHKLYRTSIRQTFQKTYLSTLIQPLSKPRPTTGAVNQGVNQYAMMSQIMYDHNYQLKQVKTMDAQMMGYKMRSRGGLRNDDQQGVSNQKLRSLLATPPPQRAHSSGVVSLRGGIGAGFKSPINTERNGLMDKNLYSNRLYQNNNEIEDEQEEDEEGLVKDGSGNNLLMNASGNEQILQKDQLVKSDMQGVFTKGQFAQIRRTSQEKNTRIADNILLYVLIGLMVFLVIGIQTILIFYLSTPFAVSSLASFFIASVLEIFLIRPFYVFLWTLIKRCSSKKKAQDEYDRIDDMKPPHENPAFMDQVNEQAAMRQFIEQEKKFERDNQEEIEDEQQQNKSGSGDGQELDDLMNNKIIDDDNHQNSEIQGKGEDGVDKLGQKAPIFDQNDEVIKAELARDQNGDLIQLNSAQGQKNLDDQFASNDPEEADKIRLKSPDPDLNRDASENKDHPQSPFGAGMSNIPRKATASFDRRGEDQDDDDIDRVAHIIVSPNKNLRSNDFPKEDDEAQGFRSLSPQNLRRNQDGIPGRKVDTKNQSYIGPSGSGDQDDLSSPVLIPQSTTGGVLLTEKDNNKKKMTPQKQKTGKKDPKSQSGTKNKSPNSQFGGSYEGQDDDLNDRSGELPLRQRLENQAIGGSAVPFSNHQPVYRDRLDQGVGDDEPMHQLMNEYAQTDLPPFVAGRKSPDIGENRPVSRLSALSPLGEFSGTGSIPEQAQISQMMMNPLDDLCPYKKVMTDVIYLSCGPQGGDQVLRKLKKKPGAQDLSIDDLQKIIDQNHYEVDPHHQSVIKNDEDDDADQTIQIKPGIKPVIPIDEHPAEDEITSSMPRSSFHGELPPQIIDQDSQQQNKKQQLTDSQLIENEMQLREQEEKANIPEQKGVDVSFAVNQDDKDQNQMFKVEAADGDQAAIGDLQNLDDELKHPLEDQILPIDDVNKSKSSMRYQNTPQPQEGQDQSRKSPSPIPSTRKSPSPIPSTRKSPSITRTPSPKRVLMGAGIAKKPSAKNIRQKQKSFQLDMGDVSGTIIMSAESGGRTPPGIQASEGFFINGPDGSQELSPVGKNRSPILHGKKKKKKKSISPLRAKPDSFRSGPKARGILATKPQDQNIEYDQGDHQDSQQIDPTIVYFKQGMGLPFDSQVSDQDYGDADIVYQKDDLTNYSKGLGINRVMNPGHLFGRKNKGKKSSKKPMTHSMYSDRLSSLGAQSEDQGRYYQRPTLNRSFRSTGSIRPASLGFTPNHRRTPYDPYGQKRVDCWNHDYIMMSELESKKPRKKKRFKRSPNYNYVQPHVYDHITNSKFYSGGFQDENGQMGAGLTGSTLYRSNKKGKLPPLNGTTSSNRPRKNNRANKRGSKDSRRNSSFEPIDMVFPDQTTNRSSSKQQYLVGGQIQQLGNRIQQRNVGTRFTDTSSGFVRNQALTASNFRGRQQQRSIQGSRMLQDQDYDGTSPYNENLYRRFHQWEPLKESKQSKRKHLNQIKADQLSKNYGGPLQVTGIATCGGVRPSQRKKWQKQHRLLEMQRSHMFQEDYSINIQGSPLPNNNHNNNRLPSNRSSRSSLPPFPPQPQANFDPKTYKQYDSDSSIHQRGNNLNSSKLNRSGVVNTSHSPIPRNQHSSVQSNRVGLPILPQNGGVMNNSAMKKQRKKKKKKQTSPGGKMINRNYDPLFNPEQTDQKFLVDTQHHTYDQHSMRSDNPVENMASPVNFGSPGVIHDDDDDEDDAGMSDDVRFSSGIKHPKRQVNPVDLGLPPLPKQHTHDQVSDQAEVEDL